MSRSVLLQLARDSIQEVLEAQRNIDKESLFVKQPLLKEPISVTVNIYIEDELRGTSKTEEMPTTLLEEIVRHAKKAVFEDVNYSPLTSSEYLSCEVELLLQTPDGVIGERDPSILKTHTI